MREREREREQGSCRDGLLGLILCAFLAITPAIPAFAADSASFDPTPYPVKAQSSGVPVGTIIMIPFNALPPGDAAQWLECDGRSTAGYPDLAALVGPNVPDYRGLFLRGYGVKDSAHASEALGVLQSDTIQQYDPDFNGGGVGTIWAQNGMTANGAFHYAQQQLGTIGGAAFGYINIYKYDLRPSQFGQRTADETRPVNTAVKYLIRAKR